jgi:hypothetical protein
MVIRCQKFDLTLPAGRQASSVIRHPSSVIRHPSSVNRHPSSVNRHPFDEWKGISNLIK